MGVMKRLDDCRDDLDLIREDITELDLDAAIPRVKALLRELERINGVGVAVEMRDRHYLDERHWVL